MRYLLFVLICFSLFLPAMGQVNGARDLEFSADEVDYDEASQKIRLVGNVFLVTEDLTLSAPYAVYNTETQYAEFVGGVKMVGRQSTASGKEMKVWYGDSKIRFSGDVRLVTKNSALGQQGEPATLLAEELDYNWETEEGRASGGVKMIQGPKNVFADQAEIYQKRGEVLLLGNVRVEQGDGDWLTAKRAVYDTVKQTVRAEGRVVARTRLKSKTTKADTTASSVPARASLPEPKLVEPAFELLPIRRVPTLPLPWLDHETE